MPVENDPADPNALTQSLQLICSLTPRSTVPSTRWVIIWLKRCLPRSLIDPALEAAPVTTGGARDPSPSAPSQLPSQSLGGGEQGPSQLVACADAGDGCSCTKSQTDATSAADAIKLRVVNLAMVSARTACRWDHRQGGGHPQNSWRHKAPPPRHRSQRRSRASCWSSEAWPCRPSRR